MTNLAAVVAKCIGGCALLAAASVGTYFLSVGFAAKEEEKKLPKEQPENEISEEAKVKKDKVNGAITAFKGFNESIKTLNLKEKWNQSSEKQKIVEKLKKLHGDLKAAQEAIDHAGDTIEITVVLALLNNISNGITTDVNIEAIENTLRTKHKEILEELEKGAREIHEKGIQKKTT